MDFCNISIFVCYQIKSDAELSDKEDDSPVKKAPSSPVHQRRMSPSPLEEVSDEEKQRRSVFIYKYKLHFFSNLNLFKPDSFILKRHFVSIIVCTLDHLSWKNVGLFTKDYST